MHIFFIVILLTVKRVFNKKNQQSATLCIVQNPLTTIFISYKSEKNGQVAV